MFLRVEIEANVAFEVFYSRTGYIISFALYATATFTSIGVGRLYRYIL